MMAEINQNEPHVAILIARRVGLHDGAKVTMHPAAMHDLGERKVSITFDSSDELLRWFDGIVKAAKNTSKADALQSLQQDARELFKKVFGVELK